MIVEMSVGDIQFFMDIIEVVVDVILFLGVIVEKQVWLCNKDIMCKQKLKYIICE